MTCPSSWETASPKWACAGVTLRQRETDWPSIRVHHRPPGTPGCLFEQSMIPVVCWSNQLHGSLCPSLPEKHIYSTLLHKSWALQIHTCCMLTHCVTVVFQHLSNLKLNKVHQDGFGEVFKSIGCRQVRNQTPLLGKHTIRTWNIITAATLTHLLTVAVQY